MICKNCGEEIKTGRRTCSKCGMPVVDYEAVPEEEAVEDLKEVGKRLRVLRSKADSEKEELDKKREEKRKKREEEEEKKKAAAVFTHKLLSEDDDDDENFDEEDGEFDEDEDEYFDFDEEDNEEDSEEDVDLYSLLSGKKSVESKAENPIKKIDDDGDEYELLDGDEELLDSGSVPNDEYDDEFLPLLELMDNEYDYAISGEHFKVKGSISYLNIDGKLNKFNIEDDDQDVECRFIMDGREEYDYEYVSYTKEEILDMLKSMRLGDELEISGYLVYEHDGAHIHVLTINGPDYYIGE